jgi:hypothetical protein
MSATNYKYIFERNGKKGECPQCGKKSFRYYDGVPREFGKCDRLNNCGFHNKPDASIKPEELPKPIEKKQLYVDALQVEKWQNNISSPFHAWANKLGISDEHLQKWNIGTSEKNETVFMYKNVNHFFYNAKFIQYTERGSRKKDVEAYSLKQTKDGKFLMCLFGEHLLDVKRNKRVCIVESEKTAVVASFFYPQYDFLACGANTGLTDEKMGVLVNRRVFNLRDSDIAGRSTCNATKMQKNGCSTFCTACIVPHIEKRLLQWKIDYQGIDLFPENTEGYDLADAIRDGLRPDISEAALSQVVANQVSDYEDDEDDIEEETSTLANILPRGVDVKETLEYGFYEYKNRYWMQRKGYEFENISNFTMKVLFLIKGVNAKRIVEIVNVYGKKAVIDMTISDLISQDKFRERIESTGNFLFNGKATDLSRIKGKLFNLEKPSQEIATLGQYKEMFYTFGNGVFDGKNFIDIDDKGMIQFECESLNDKGEKVKQKEHFYIPVLGSIQADDNEDLRNYRKFIHRPSAVTFQEWAKLFIDVYGDNGKIGLAFCIVSLFRDFIQDKRKFTPMLFLFGQRGSGKGTMANSMLNLWGSPQDPLMLGGASTVVGFMRKLGQFQNAIVWLDEYKNDIDEKKIESLKNIWDGIGYERGVKDGGSSKTQTSPVRSAAMLSGQEMPNREPALFSRNILVTFKTTNGRTQQDINNFNNLREMEEKGITNATLELLRHRDYFKETFEQKFNEVAKMLRNAVTGEVIERQILNHAVLIAAVWTMKEKVKLPFDEIELIKISEKLIDEQKLMMRTSNEVQQFFEMVYYLLSNHIIFDENALMFRGEFVMIRLKEIIPFYRQHSKQQGLKPLDKGTLESYLEASEAYDDVESKKSHRFKKLQNPTTARVFLQEEIIKLYGINLLEAIQIQKVDE